MSHACVNSVKQVLARYLSVEFRCSVSNDDFRFHVDFTITFQDGIALVVRTGDNENGFVEKRATHESHLPAEILDVAQGVFLFLIEHGLESRRDWRHPAASLLAIADVTERC